MWIVAHKDYLIVDFRPYSKNVSDFKDTVGTTKVLKKVYKKNYWIVVYEDRPREELKLTVIKYGSNAELVEEIVIVPI